MEPVSLRERNRQRVTQRIISVAESLFKAYGFERTTMDDIADKAEISRATLFNYFPSKEALITVLSICASSTLILARMV